MVLITNVPASSRITSISFSGTMIPLMMIITRDSFVILMTQHVRRVGAASTALHVSVSHASSPCAHMYFPFRLLQSDSSGGAPSAGKAEIGDEMSRERTDEGGGIDRERDLTAQRTGGTPPGEQCECAEKRHPRNHVWIRLDAPILAATQEQRWRRSQAP